METRLSSIPLVAAVQRASAEWAKDGYKSGTSPTTRRLLEWWFIEDHLVNKEKFEFWPSQRRGIEALVYAYEVLGVRNLYGLAQQLQVQIPVNPTTDNRPKYALKMATGSGKTTLMAMAIAWSYFNFLKEKNEKDFTNNFLMIAPNLIVLDRLMGDSKKPEYFGAHIFKNYPLVPPEWSKDFHIDVVGPDDPPIPRTPSALFITNWQKFVERTENLPTNPVQEALGAKPPVDLLAQEPLLDVLRTRKNLMVLNDEAHHVWDEGLVWTKAIDELNKSNGVMCQLDFSATPKDQKGQLFPHVIAEYKLGEAIEDQIVKRPKIAEIEDLPEIESDDASEKYRVQIDAGVEKWRQFHREHTKSGKKPVLFVLADKTKSADQIKEYLDGFDELRDRVLVIHTDNTGEVSKKDLDVARKAAREIDSDENPYRAVVSVLMLREGWDVRNVVVIVPLRSLTAKSKILPEQTLGRGLRRMLPNQLNWTEELLVVEHPAFHDILDEAMAEQGYKLEFTPVQQPEKLPVTIMVDEAKKQYDLTVPITRGGMTRSMKKLEDLKIINLPAPLFNYADLSPREIKLKTRDMLTKQIEKQEVIDMPFADRPEVYIAAITKKIEKFARLTGQFEKLVPLTKSYIQDRLFDKKIDFTPDDLKKLNSDRVRLKLVEVFVDNINDLTAVSEDIEVTEEELRATDAKPFPWSRDAYEAKKTVLNLVPVANKLELNFARILDNDDEVVAFIKNETRPATLGLQISYVDANGFVRNYVPDFIIKTEDAMWVIETKGKEDIDVKFKDKRAREWCESVTNLTGKEWRYVRVDEQRLAMGSSFKLSDLV